MADAQQLHDHAKTLRALAASAGDDEVQRKLVALAQEYEAKAAQANAAARIGSHR